MIETGLSQRLVWTGAAVASALAIQIIALPSLGWPLALAFAALCGYLAYGGGTSRAPADFGSGGAVTLLRASAIPGLLKDMPSREVMSAEVATLLRPLARARRDVPPTLDIAIAQVLHTLMTRWGARDPLRLTDGEAAILCLVDRLCRAEPDKAGKLAQNFRRPDVLLEMRARAQALAADRAAHDRSLAAHAEASALWQGLMS